MPTTVQLRTRLLKKLKELFQLDQPDLDFGFYKIMHAKAEQVERFIDDDLLRIVEEAFTHSVAEKAENEVDAAKRKLIEAMGEEVFDADGVISEDAAKYPAGKAYTEALQKAGGQVSSLTEEGQVYDHLFRFFERYYDNGDFVSRRYYTRETDDRAAPFAVPYNGEEVKLHWANADQYYIKTAEYFNNFTFDLSQAAEFRAMNALERTAAGVPDAPVKVHFKIVDASEGEHGNVKTKDDDKRFFIIHQDEPITFDENGELVVHFEYRADPEKGSKQEGSWRDFRNTEAVEVILKALQAIKEDNPTAAACLQLLQAPAPTDKNKSRPLLAKYLNQYTARNTMDYFIHKNLGGFLRRELDFYIKNEVMRLDDLDQADAPAVESYLAKLKVLRKIAHKLIDFLAQLEDFQKKLWLKKKFVVETNYCITLDRVPEALYEAIAANDAQREEWVKLFAIDEIEASTVTPAYSAPLSLDFLKANNKLMLDTKFFDESFKARLLESIEDFDAQCDGLLVHSENFQGLSTLQHRYSDQVKCTYIDPPYNTGADSDFFYKDEYRYSTWIDSGMDPDIGKGISLPPIPAPAVVVLDYLLVIVASPLPFVADIVLRMMADRFPEIRKIMPSGLAKSYAQSWIEKQLDKQVEATLDELDQRIDSIKTETTVSMNKAIESLLEAEVAPLKMALRSIDENRQPWNAEVEANFENQLKGLYERTNVIIA